MKKAVPVLIVLFVVSFGGIFLAFRKEAAPTPDMIAVNDIVMSVMESEDQTEAAAYVAEQLTQVFEDMDTERRNRDMEVQRFLYIFIGVCVISSAVLILYCERSVLMPFRKLQDFARHIAAGNLDISLTMDKNNLFGAFTESFDLMREELHRAQENERNANRSKKELVASLSHDIKTPVASIKAATEFMLIKERDEAEIKQLEKIGAKAEQINTLITNLFHATLEELQELSVVATEVHSTIIPGIIQNADYEGRVTPFFIPSCIISIDLLRFQQVLDNVISNSYKYADTDIVIQAAFDEQFLVIDIMDFGDGVSEKDLPLLFHKFYRGENSDGKSGYGLGLYIAKYLMEQMGGTLQCENRIDGFTVRLTLRLAG